MGPIHLFDIASLQARWLTIRQTAIATNISNANSPGFSALDVHPFQDVLDKTQLNLSTTNVGHISIAPTELTSANTTKSNDPWEVMRSGNSVSLEQEMMKAGDVNRAYSLNTSIVKAFNAMLTQAVKG